VIDLPPRVSRIVLIGLMGSGKSTVGQMLAQRLGWRLIDLDREIEGRTGHSIARIFHDNGEQAFRSLEQQLTAELLSLAGTVFTPGGGWIINAQNMKRVPSDSAVFWLQVSPEEAIRRVQADSVERPLLRGNPLERARTLAAERAAAYGAAGIPVNTDGRTPAEIVEDILIRLGGRASAVPANEEQNG
jgi:shikimate kinase